MGQFKAEKKGKHEIPPLLYPPLVEAIFEIRWELQGDQKTGRFRDVAYPMMYGRIYERLKKDFPLIEDLPSVQVHPEASPFVVRHRLRKERNGWPLLQIGPGIATINDAKGYSWSTLKNLVLRMMEAIIDSFPTGSLPLNFIKSEMRYINGIPFDFQRENAITFLEEKLHLKIDVEKQIFDMNEMSEKPNSVNLNLAYALNRPVGNLMLSVNLGQLDVKPAYIVQTVVQSMGETVAQDETSMAPWLNEAHSVLENCFLSLCKGSLMQRFSGN